MADAEYEKLRQQYKPSHIEWLFVTESAPPAASNTKSTRQFYRIGNYDNDRLFWSTMKALYPEARDLSKAGLEKEKAKWLERFKNDGCYQVESLDESLPHGTTTSQRHKALRDNVPQLIKKLQALVQPETKIILIKSTTYKMTAEALKEAGLNVVNDTFVDYPGFWREQQFRQKVSELMTANDWKY
jgi:hypothetical protein